MRTIELTTGGSIEARDVTDLVMHSLAGNTGEAFAWISTPHTTAAVIVCESDPEMLRDIERVAAGLFASFEPFEHRKNNNPNAAAHLFSSLMGSHVLLPVDGSELRLGTYQRVIFVELDGPRTRLVHVALLAAVAG